MEQIEPGSIIIFFQLNTLETVHLDDMAIRRNETPWPTLDQALRQLGVILLVVVVWGALLAGYQRLTGGSDAEPMASQPEPTQIVAASTDTPTAADVVPTDTPPLPTEATNTSAAENETSSPAVSFSADVFPILESRCVQCHGPSSARGGVKVDSYDAVMTIVTPGDAEASSLVTVVVNGDMPRRGPKLLPSEIEIISTWVNAGAPDN